MLTGVFVLKDEEEFPDLGRPSAGASRPTASNPTAPPGTQVRGYSHTILLYYCTTVLLYHTILLYYCTIVLLYHSTTVPYYNTVLLYQTILL